MSPGDVQAEREVESLVLGTLKGNRADLDPSVPAGTAPIPPIKDLAREKCDGLAKPMQPHILDERLVLRARDEWEDGCERMSFEAIVSGLPGMSFPRS